jgi:hypothetical protein
MSQEEKDQAPGTAPRTVIEDLPRGAEELSEEAASEAVGGLVPGCSVIALLKPIGGSTDACTRVANTCTAGNALTGPDEDYGND